MSRRLATLFYLAALMLTPVSVACKFLLGATNVVWIDPSLLLSLVVLLALLPRWEDFLEDELRFLVAGAAVLFLASLCSAFSGALLRPPSSLYTVLREPSRLWLSLGWFLTCAWFLKHQARTVFIGAVIAVMLGLVVVLHRLRGAVNRRIWSGAGMTAAALGALFSLSDQALFAGAVGVFSELPQLAKKRPATTWLLAFVMMIVVCVFEFQSIDIKQASSTTGVVTRINGGSVAERSLHLRYGWLLLGAHPAATLSMVEHNL